MQKRVLEIETKEFEVNGLDSYIESYGNLSDSCRTEIYSSSKDCVAALIADKSRISYNLCRTSILYLYDVDSENVEAVSA